MADVTAAHRGPDGARQLFRQDRVYLGWQYRPAMPDPGPPPRRPTPPEQEQLNPEWVAAQRREENLLNRPLKVACGVALAFAAALLAAWITGLLGGPLAGLGVMVCLVAATLSGYALWQGEQALKSRVDEERQRLGKIRSEQENRLFAWQAEHKRRFHEWEERRAAYDRQLQWYAVSLPDAVDRVDVAGGTLASWSALATVIGASRLSAGGEVTLVDLSEGATAADLVSAAQRCGIDPLVWVLPVDLPRVDLGTGLRKEELADVLSLVVSVTEEHASTRDLSYDNAILERVLEVFGGQATVAQVTAALRALAQVGDPRDDVKLGLIDPDQLERLAAMFGRGAADRVVIERAWAMESQLRKLENLGAALTQLAPAPLRVVSTDRRAGVFGNKVLGTFVVTALTHLLRQAPAGRPWEHTVVLLGAEKLRGDVLDRLCDACESTRTGLVLAYRFLPAHVKERLGRGNAAVAFMRLGNAEDARTASEQIGTEHRFVVNQLTETVGTAVTDTVGSSYTSTVGTADSLASSSSTSVTEGRSRGRGVSGESVLAPFGRSTRFRARDASSSLATSDGETLTEGIMTSTAWGLNTSLAFGANQSLARGSQRSREFLVEQHELQRLPPSALIISHAGADGRRIVLADANPAIIALPTATLLGLDEARRSAPPDRAGSWLAGATAPGGPGMGPGFPGGPGAGPGGPGAGPAGPGAGRNVSGAAPYWPASQGSAAHRGGAAERGGAAYGPGWRASRGAESGNAWQASGSGHTGDEAWPSGGDWPMAESWPSGPNRPEEDDWSAVGGAGPSIGTPPGAIAGTTPGTAPGGAPGAAPGGAPGTAPDGTALGDVGGEPAQPPDRPGRSPKPASWQGEDQPPPNLGPPPDRLDWRKKPRDTA